MSRFGMLGRMQFPSVEGENLTGQRVVFPRDFVDRKTIAIIAFDLKQRHDLESWAPFIDGYARAGTVDGRIFPVMPRSMQMMKGMILATMRKAVPSEARAATVPLFVDIDAFCAALGITDRSALYVGVIEPGGNTHELQSGVYSTPAATAIEAQIKAPA